MRISRFLVLPLLLTPLAGHATPPAAGELRYIAYTTGYATLDNTPPGTATSGRVTPCWDEVSVAAMRAG